MYTTYSICTAISSENFFKYKINITYKYSGLGGGGGVGDSIRTPSVITHFTPL